MRMSYKANKAIIMAAGKGTRMAPITNYTPKPLVKVNGVRMIDTVIDALHQNGIEEIYIVVGYLKEKFTELLEKYPNLCIIENPYYDTCNNISSLFVARDHIENAIILDGDQIVYNPEILNPNFEKSGYCCRYAEDETNEWLLTLNENDSVVHCSPTGGSNGWQLFSVSLWNEHDGKKLKKLLELEFIENKNTDIYWDNIALLVHPDLFELGIRKINKEDIIEIDNYSELIQLDPSYEKEAN